MNGAPASAFEEAKRRYWGGEAHEAAKREARALKKKGYRDDQIVAHFGYHPLREKLSDVKVCSRLDVVRPDEAQQAEILARYDRGESLAQIMAATHVGWRNIRSTVVEAGRILRPGGRMAGVEVDGPGHGYFCAACRIVTPSFLAWEKEALVAKCERCHRVKPSQCIDAKWASEAPPKPEKAKRKKRRGRDDVLQLFEDDDATPYDRSGMA